MCVFGGMVCGYSEGWCVGIFGGMVCGYIRRDGVGIFGGMVWVYSEGWCVGIFGGMVCGYNFARTKITNTLLYHLANYYDVTTTQIKYQQFI